MTDTTPGGVVRWENPPPQRRGDPSPSNQYKAAADTLRTRPGEWGLVRDDVPTGTASGLVQRIKHGWTCFAPAASFEAVSRPGSRDGRSRVYARYVGDSQTIGAP